MGQGPKPRNGGHLGTMGLPKAYVATYKLKAKVNASYGNGSAVVKATIIRSEGRKDKTFNKNTLITNQGEELIELNKTNAKLKDKVVCKKSYKEIFQKLKIQGFVKSNARNGWATPTRVKRLVNMDHADIVSYYNSVRRGLLDYYSFADNRCNLGSVSRALQMSCARTLALKYKLRFAAKAFKKFGKHLADPRTGLCFLNVAAINRKQVPLCRQI